MVKVEIMGPLLVPSSEMSHLEHSHIWWQPEDFEIFQGTAQIISAEIQRRSDSGQLGSYARTLLRVKASYISSAESTAAVADENGRYNPLSESDRKHLVH